MTSSALQKSPFQLLYETALLQLCSNTAFVATICSEKKKNINSWHYHRRFKIGPPGERNALHEVL